jgi:hypothetical protein
MGMDLGLRKLFGRKRSIEKVSIDELRKEKVALSQEERRLIGRLEQLEDAKAELLDKIADETSQLKKVVLARKIKEVDAQAKNINRNLRFLSTQIRTLNGFIQVKENMRLIKERGLSSVLSKLDMEGLEAFVQKAMLEDEFQLGRFMDMLQTLEESEDVLVQGSQEDPDIARILQIAEEYKEAREQGDEEARKLAARRVDEVLSSQEEREGEAPEGLGV